MLRDVGLFPALVITVFLLASQGSPQASQSPYSVAAAARGVLDRNCLSCHGEVSQSGLDMRQRAALLQGGVRGPSVIPGNASESLLFRAAAQVGDLRMPPSGPALPEEDLELLRRWINSGVPWDLAEAQTPSEPSWWSFRKLRRPSVSQPAAGVGFGYVASLPRGGDALGEPREILLVTPP